MADGQSGGNAVRKAIFVVGAAGALALAAPAFGGTLKLGVSLKHLGAGGVPGDYTGDFRAVEPSVDTMLTAIRWKTVQPTCEAIDSRTYNWRKLDELMTLWADAGKKMVATLKGGPDCASVGPETQPKRAYLDDWARFAGQVADRYGPNGSYPAHPLRHIEVWSEQNLRKWTTEPEDYARAFIDVAQRVRSADPSVKVITGGLGHHGHPLRFLERLYRVRGFEAAAQQVGMHTYSATPDAALKLLDGVRRVMRSHRHSAPIVVTEHGWSTCPRPDLDRTGKCVTKTKQADYLDRYVRGLRREGRLGVTAFYWFMGQDLATRESVAACPRAPKHFYGFFTHGGARKPSAGVWSRLTGRPLPQQVAASTLLKGCD